MGEMWYENVILWFKIGFFVYRKSGLSWYYDRV